MTKAKKKNLAPAKERTEADEKALEAYNLKKASKPSLPKMSLKLDEGENTFALNFDDPDFERNRAALCSSLGTADNVFALGLLGQLANAGGVKQFRFMASMVAGIEPRDQTEAMLAAQMATVHSQSMEYGARMTNAKSYMESEMAEKAMNRLMRTFTAQMEALGKYRGKGEQKVTVEHVHVHEGGQAIVGNIEGGGRTIK